MKASDPRHPLYESLLKVNRAKDQYFDLKREIDAFLATSPYVVDIVTDPDAKQIRAVLRVQNSPPPHWSVVIGEIIHNLRCSLDYMVFQLVLHHTGAAPSENSRTQFPIYRTEGGFSSRGISIDLRGVEAGAQTLIRSMQPFATGEDVKSPLWHLRVLSNWDKHRAIALTGVTRGRGSIGGRYSNLGVAHGEPLVDGATVMWLEPASADMDFAEWAAKSEPRFDASFEIAFAAPAHECGLTINIVLAAISARVYELAAKINAQCFASIWGAR